MLKKKWYVSNKKNLAKLIAEGYEVCPFTIGGYYHWKYLKLTSDGYIEFSNNKESVCG